MSRTFARRSLHLPMLTWLTAIGLVGNAQSPQPEPPQFSSGHCSGAGDTGYLRLLNDSLAMFKIDTTSQSASVDAASELPNIAMIYNYEWDTLTEGSGWGGWWNQNSYGAVYGSLPFLDEPYLSMLRRAQDLFWDNMGDGKRIGLWGGKPDANHLSNLVGPDGCLGDAAGPGMIAYKQGDGDPKVHDWFYEASAAGLLMQAEDLLISRDPERLTKYLPKMERTCNFIEGARDPRNNLFLVGPGTNLLAPSFCGALQPDGTLGKAYLAGLSITYLGALNRMVELYKLTGDTAKQALFEQRQAITRASLPLLIGSNGAFVKSVETSGTLHGHYGAPQFGYFEVSPNVDAIMLRTVDQTAAEKIYAQIAAIPQLRPHDWLITNYPSLDDQSSGYGTPQKEWGDWVNGGVWGTLEGRAIMAYARLGEYDDLRRSAERAMRTARDFRMDAPFSQFGANTANPWYKDNPTAIMIDNFAIPAATIRGLMEYVYKADQLELYPHVPPCITRYEQHDPIRFGSKRLTIAIHNGGPRIESIRVNGEAWEVTADDYMTLPYEKLPAQARVEITMSGGWPAEAERGALSDPQFQAVSERRAAIDATTLSTQSQALSAELTQPRHILRALAGDPIPAPELAYAHGLVRETSAAFAAWEARLASDGPAGDRPAAQLKREGILIQYRASAYALYSELQRLMKRYATDPNSQRQALAARWAEASR